MKSLIISILCVAILNVTALAVENTNEINKQSKDKVTMIPQPYDNRYAAGGPVITVDAKKLGELSNIKEGWVAIVTNNTVVATDAVLQIRPDMPPKEREEKIKTAVMAVDKMREEGKKEGIIVDGFSIGLPASFSVNFKFKDKE